jgi:ABC-type multidrug transport system permease subunit
MSLSLGRSPIYQLTRSRVVEFLREPEAIFWVFCFPVLLAVALGVAFRSQAPEALPVGVEAGARAEVRRDALELGGELAAAVVDRATGERDLRTGKLALVVLDTEPPTYWFDPTRPDSRIARALVDDALQQDAGRGDAFHPTMREMTDKGSRYIDFLIPGLLGMNLMGTGMWSVGFSLVQQRAGKLLKLYVAAPMRRWHLLLAQVLARFVFLALEVAILVLFAVWVLDVPFRGSVVLFSLAASAGALAFVGLGILVASRPKTIEGVSGLMNLAMFPGWIFSGVFFSTERFPDSVQPVIQVLPLTALNDALRAVMLDGAGWAAVSGELAILGAWGAVGFLLALRLFRWQ